MEPRAKSHSVEGGPIQATFLRHERKEDLQFYIPQSDFWLETSCFGSVMVFAWLCRILVDRLPLQGTNTWKKKLR